MTPYYKNDRVTLYHGDCREIIPALNQQFDAVISDPPYCMLKIHWDKEDVFLGLIPTIASVMKKSSSVVFFGRGDSAYRQNIALGEVGFEFKEEIVWNKCRVGSPLNAVPRSHELVFLRCRDKSLNRVKIAVEEMNVIDVKKIIGHVRRIRDGLVGKHVVEVVKYINDLQLDLKKQKGGSGLSVNKSLSGMNRCITSIRSIADGFMPVSIIADPPDHYNREHPTQKPIFILSVLIRLASDENSLILDPFEGSGSTGIAAMKTGRRAILIEQDEKYCEIAARRIEEEDQKLKNDLFQNCAFDNTD